MTRFERMIRRAAGLRRQMHRALPSVADEVGRLYEDPVAGSQVSRALQDPFFPLSLYAKHHLGVSSHRNVQRAGQDLALLSQMFLRIRRDIGQYFHDNRITCVDLSGNAFQDVVSEGWCSLCGDCCQLAGTVPDPPDSVRYPGYWYAYIAGDGPVRQRFCPFLFELPPQGRFFCAIHRIKPLTCLAFDKADCQEKHPGRVRD